MTALTFLAVLGAAQGAVLGLALLTIRRGNRKANRALGVFVLMVSATLSTAAMVDLDGFQFGDVFAGEVGQPFMMVYSEPFSGGNEFIEGNFGNAALVLSIAGSTHMNFSDWPVVLPITQRLGLAGSIEPARAASIIKNYVRAFFDKHLKGVDSPLLQSEESTYPEVRVAARTP